jgi:hypothetical protein
LCDNKLFEIGEINMLLVQKLKQFERQIIFLRWGSSAEYGKIKYVGRDFVEFEILDVDDLEYTETIIINPNLILEVILGGPDISRVIAEVSCKLPSNKTDTGR